MADDREPEDRLSRRIDIELDVDSEDPLRPDDARSTLFAALYSLPQSKVVGELAVLADVGEAAFLIAVTDWLREYGQVVSVARSSAAEMARELNDYRTFGQVLRRLIAGQEGSS